MYISDFCVNCLYKKQEASVPDKRYLAEIKEILENRGEADTSPYMLYRFNQVYEKHFGKQKSFSTIKKQYNNLVLSMEGDIRRKIEGAEDPLAKAMVFARIGNYIDFGAVSHVDTETFLKLFEQSKMSEQDLTVYQSFLKQCEAAEKFLLITDNCGEIVLDKLFLEQLKKRFPGISIKVLVRGGEVLNDATMEDAVDAGITELAEVVTNGMPIAGTVYSMLSEEGKKAFDEADVRLAKGQGNYESLSRQGWKIFYAFLCKCDLFVTRFQVPQFTGMFVEEA